MSNYTAKYVDDLDGYYAVFGPDGKEISGKRIAQLLNEHKEAVRAARLDGAAIIANSVIKDIAGCLAELEGK